MGGAFSYARGGPANSAPCTLDGTPRPALLGIQPRVKRSGDTTPCKTTGVTLHRGCIMTGVTLHKTTGVTLHRAFTSWCTQRRAGARAARCPPRQLAG